MRPTTDISGFYDDVPGLYINVPMQEYISHHAIGRSSLGVVADKSPAHLQALIKKNESKNSVSLSLGTALHTAILEPEKFKERYVKEPYKLDKRRKQDKEIFQLLSEQYGAENILSENDWNRVEGMREALLANQLFSDLIEADVLTEATMLWKDPSFNLLCKARPDIMVDTSSFGEEGVVVPDIKTTSDARKFFFGRAMLSFNYYLQAQHYKEGVESLNMPFRDFIFFAVESEPPHCVCPYTMDAESWRIAEEDLFYAKALYHKALKDNNWHGYSPDLQYISIPYYAGDRERNFEIE